MLINNLKIRDLNQLEEYKMAIHNSNRNNKYLEIKYKIKKVIL